MPSPQATPQALLAEARTLLAGGTSDSKNRQQAETLLWQVLELSPGSTAAAKLLAPLLLARKEHKLAAHMLEATLTHLPMADPRAISLYNMLGLVYRRLQNPHKSLVAFQNALYGHQALPAGTATSADYAAHELRRNVATALTEAGELESAKAVLWALILSTPQDGIAHFNLGCLKAQSFDPAEALPHLRQAHRLGVTDAATNIATTLLRLGKAKQSISWLEQALAADPQNLQAKYNMAWALLITGQWRKGWAYYIHRYELPRFATPGGLKGSSWTGQPATEAGQVLLVHAEQGLGDTIQFCRLLPALKTMWSSRFANARIVLACHRPLMRLLRRNTVADQVVPLADPPPHHEHVALLDLPHRLNLPTPEDMQPVDGFPYIRPIVGDRVSGLSLITEEVKVGLVWAGSMDNQMDRYRSCPPELLLPLLDIPGISWLSLQTPEPNETPEALRQLPGINGKVNDMAETAAVMAGLDLVIGVDTAVTHLAAAMNIPTWVMLAHAPDFRWGEKAIRTPWYPAMRLFRQPRLGAWEGPIRAIERGLRRCLR